MTEDPEVPPLSLGRIPAALLAFALALGSPGTAVASGVVVAAATRIDLPLTVEGLGTARANESVEVRPQISETVTAIRFREGQAVNAGEVLIELDDAEALAAVAAARATLVESDNRYRRAQELFRSELTSASDLETLEARRDADRAALEAAEARLAETVVRAPFAGRLGLRRVSVGALVSPGTIITTLDDTETIKLDFDVPEAALGQLREGLPIVARSAAWPDTVFGGSVAAIDTRVDPVSRTVAVRALVPNDGALLRPGMFLAVELLRRDVTALVIPEHAIVPVQSKQFVLVVGEDGKVERTEVTTGRRLPGLVQVTAGLQEGALVIVEGTQKARPGTTVEIERQVEVGP